MSPNIPSLWQCAPIQCAHYNIIYGFPIGNYELLHILLGYVKYDLEDLSHGLVS